MMALMETPSLGYVIVYVPDVLSTVDFYERAFGLARRFVHDSGQYAELETGATALAFVQEDFVGKSGVFALNRPGAKAAGAEVALVIKDVKAAYQRALDAGAVSVSEPEQKPWGQTVSYVRDANGFLVELCSPMG